MKRVFRYQDAINKELAKFFQKKRSTLSDPLCLELLEAIAEFTLRDGKRLRPSSVLFAYACFKKINDQTIKTCIFAELMQSYLLIHDDILDRDDLRRGKPSLHKHFQDKYGREKDAAHVGRSLAILAGDLAANFVTEPILSGNFPSNVKLAILRLINATITQEIYGQQLDFLAQDTLTEDDVLNIYRLKSVPYTTACPLRAGALLAGASQPALKLLASYADRIGLVFQIQDDILGLFGDSEKTGKSAASDIKEGKKTPLLLRAMAKAGKRERDFLQKCLGDRNCSARDLQRFRSIVRKSGALRYYQRYASALAAEGKQIIGHSGFRKEGRQLLDKLAVFMAERER